jgi:Flp pilus assembly secretin CpaC
MTSRWTLGLSDAELPPNWAREGDGSYYCLACRRERAIEVMLAETSEVGAEARAKLRSAAVIEFEIKRDPERQDNQIAKACGTSTVSVRKARDRLGMVRGSE